MEFIVHVKGKGWIAGQTNGRWIYSETAPASDITRFTTSGGSCTIEGLPIGKDVGVYETAILTSGYSMENQKGGVKQTTAGINFVNHQKTSMGSTGGTITVENIPDVTNITVKKVWSGTPASGNVTVTAHLYANGVDVEGSPFEFNGNGSKTFNNLPLCDADGNEINYTVEEAELADNQKDVKKSIEGPTKTSNGYTFTIKNTVDKPINIIVQKIWRGETPKSGTKVVKIHVTANGKDIAGSPVTFTGNSSAAFNNLPRFDNDGNEINYNAYEEIVGDSSDITSSQSSSTSGNTMTFTFTNTVKGDTTQPDNGEVTLIKDRRRSNIYIICYQDRYCI